jgi:hypothetical protein
MSPSEFDLRAALRDGEGDGVNVERVIAGAQATRARHRTWLLSAAAAVVVAGVGTGSAVVWGGGSGGGPRAEGANSRANGPAHGALPANGPAHGSAAGPAKSPTAETARPVPNSAASTGTAVACPSTYPHYLVPGGGSLVPGGGSPGQFGSDGPLFSKPVVALVVCGYGTAQEAASLKPPARPGRLVLTGDNATRLAASLENAPKTAPGCGGMRTAPHSFVIIGIGSDGSRVGTVTATYQSCDEITNGTAIRFEWQPPADLAPVIENLVPIKGTVLKPSPPVNHGSPPR